jgi:uncharacterized protein
MEAIYIPQLTRAPEQTEVIKFNQTISGLATLTPVQGWVRVKHHGNFLEVDAQAETIVTLTCNRCLQQYNYKLSITPSELIWLDESADHLDALLLDREITSDDLLESLSPTGYFEPETWVYEQLCLAIPLRQLCDAQCQGIQVPEAKPPQSSVDRRWAGLEAFKDQFSQN